MQSIRNLSRRGCRRSSASATTAGTESLPSVFRTRPRFGSSEILLLNEIRSAFDPNSRGIQRWHQLRLLMILYEALVIPFLAVFYSRAGESAMRRHLAGVYLCEALFCVDVYVQLNMGYYEDGDMLRDSRKSRLKYLKSPAFALDMLALLPFSLLLSNTPVAADVPLAVFEMPKLVRVWRLPELISGLDNLYARHFALLKLAKVLGLTLVLSHLVACGRFMFGTDAHHADPWVQQVHGGDGHARSTQTAYLAAVFWAFGLLTGLFEGELPQNSTAFAFTILVAFCGFSLFTYLCATFFLLSKCESGDSETAEARVNQLKHLLAFHRVPDELKKSAVEYLKQYHTQAEANDRQAAKLLCPSIASDIQIELLRESVARIPVFAGCDLRFVNAVTSLLELVSFPAHFTLFRAGDRGDAMYVVHSGVLHTVVDGVKVRELRKGSFFGEVAVFARLPRSAAMVTTTYCTLYRLSQFHVDKLLDGYPRYAKRITETVQTIIGARPENGQGGASDRHREGDDDGRSASATVSGMTRGRVRLSVSSPQLVGLKQAVKALAKSKTGAVVKKAGATVEPLASPAMSNPSAEATSSRPSLPSQSSLPVVAIPPAVASSTTTNVASVAGPVLPDSMTEPSVGPSLAAATIDGSTTVGPNALVSSNMAKTNAVGAPTASVRCLEQLSPSSRRLETKQSSRFDLQLQSTMKESSASSSSKGPNLRAIASDSREVERRSASLVSRLQARRLSLKVYPSSPHMMPPKFQSQQQLVKDQETKPQPQQRPSFILLQGINALQFVRTSFFGSRDRVVPTGGPDAIRGFYDNIQGSGALSSARAHWWARLLLKECIDVNTWARIAWVLVIQLVCCYDWVLVPLELSFKLSDTPFAWVIDALNAAVDTLLWADLYVNLNLSFFVNAEKISDPTRSAERYLRSWSFALDVLTSWPYWVFAPVWFVASSGGILRIPRLLRVWRTRGYIAEADEFFHFNSKQRLLLFGLLLVMLYHVVACLFFSITYIEGFSLEESAWIPSHDVELHRVNASHYEDYAGNLITVDSAQFVTLRSTQYFRALYYAANVLAALGRTIEPASDAQYAAALGFMLSGFVITAIVVDEVMKRFTASAFEQKEFFEVRTRIQLFLKRQDAPLAIHQRVNSFLDFWWSAHRGAIIDEILQELPESIKRDIVRSICAPAVETLKLMFELANDSDKQHSDTATSGHPSPQSTSNEANDSTAKTEEASLPSGGDLSVPVTEVAATPRAQIETIVLDNVKFVLYGQHEVIYRPGDYAAGLFFLLEGDVSMLVEGEGPRKVPIGGFFGSAALQRLGADAEPLSGSSSSQRYDTGTISYTELVTAVSGCIVVFLSREHLDGMTRCLPSLPAALWQLERQLRHVTITRTTELKLVRPGTLRVASSHPPPLRRMRHGKSLLKSLVRLSHKYVSWNNAMTFDPDAAAVRGWDTLVFALSGVQCARVMTNICLGVAGTGASSGGLHDSDSGTLALELVFLMDMYVQSRLGFYEFGNKSMDRDAIRRHYFFSRGFVVDVAALIPLFAINTALPHRLEVLNLNKMLRALKFPRQFHSLSTRFVKLMVEIRLLKLAFYTFFATHILGCIWFDFAANNSGFHSVIGITGAGEEAHGLSESSVASSGTHSSVSHRLLSFGDNEWLPPEWLEHVSRLQQYLSSLFWAFGLMSASSTGELPKTVSQSIFSVITMTVGFFLLAYVIGNFSDIIELQESDNKHFVAQVSSLRKLLHHFKLPAGVEDKFKKYFLFKRFHSITQEHVLDRVLPPSLVVDIRLFQLQPMIVKVAFLVGMEEAVTRMLVSLFTQVLHVKDEYVCRFGEEGQEMFFIFTGVLDIYIPVRIESTPSVVFDTGGPSADTLRKVNEITAGSYFGEAALFTNTPRNAYVKASTSCILYQLSRHSLELVFERFPDWKQKVLRIVKIQQQQQRLARLAQESQATPSSKGIDKGDANTRQRGLRRTMSRMDALNTRAEGMEELLLSNRRTSSVHTQSWVAIARQRARVLPVVKKFMAPQVARLRRLRVLLVRGTDIQSKYFLIWLRLVTVCIIFMAISLPYRIAYDSLERDTFVPMLIRVCEGVSEIVFWWDVWFHFHVRESHEAMELYEQDHLQNYKRERLLVDIAAAFPLDHFLSGFVAAALGYSMADARRWLRLNRCLKMINFVYYRNEITRRSVAYEANRVVTLWLQYLLVIFWVSCAYFAVSMHEGFGDEWQAWRPPNVLDLPDDPPPELLLLRLLRGFFYATTAFVKKGKTFTPTAHLDTSFSIIASFVGQIVMAIMISEIANVFLLYIDNEVQFRKNHITVEHFLARSKVSAPLKLRAHAFLSSWWSSHAGIDYQLIFNELPQSVRTEGVAYIVAKPLSKFMECVFRPLLPRYSDAEVIAVDATEGSVHRLARAIAQRLRFVGYPRDESVIVEGSVCRAMYFVVKGDLLSKSVSNPALYHGGRFHSGDYFGDTGLLGHSVSLFTVTTIRACDLFVLDAQQLEEVVRAHPFYALVLQAAAIAVRRKKTVEELFCREDAAEHASSRTNSSASARLKSTNSRHATHMASLMDATGVSSEQQPGPQSQATVTQAPERLSSEEQATVDQLKKLVGAQASELTWRAAFRQFTELILARGSMDTDEQQRESVQSVTGKADGEQRLSAGGPTRAGVRQLVQLT